MSTAQRATLSNSSTTYATTTDTTTYTTTTTTTATVGGSLQSGQVSTAPLNMMPKIAVRFRHFQDLPEELGNEIFQYYMRCKDGQETSEIARRLRKYACISKAHRDEVNLVLAEDKQIALAATYRAIPAFIEKRHETYIPKEIKPAMRIKAMVKDHPVLYADFSFGVQMGWGFSKVRHNRRPKKTMKMLLGQPGIQTIRLDISGPPKSKLISEFRDAPMNDIEKRFVWIGKHDRFVKSVAKQVNQFTLSDSSTTPIEIVYRNWPDSALVTKLLTELSENPEKVRELDLSNGFEYEEISASIFHRAHHDLAAQFIDPLCKLLTQSSALKSLKLSDARMGSASLTGLVNALSQNNSLEFLDLSNNTIRLASLQRLTASLERNVHLKTLILSETDLTDEGADALLELLHKNPTIQQLELSNNSAISKSHPIWTDPRVRAHS